MVASTKAVAERGEVMAVAPVGPCRLCGCGLGEGKEDNLELRLCGHCKLRPEARRLGVTLQDVPRQKRKFSEQLRRQPAREFTAAEKSLISKVHGFMPADLLLSMLNERLACDLGEDAVPYNMEQLHKAIGGAAKATPDGGHDWASLRKLLAQAKRDGVLKLITEQVINDFAVVFQLSPKQVMGLKDIVLKQGEDE